MSEAVSFNADAARPSLTRELCDAALAALKLPTPRETSRRRPFPGGEIVPADPERAREYLLAGKHALDANEDPVGALPLLDASLRLDYIAALDDGEVLVTRCTAFRRLGRDQPMRSLLLHHHALAFRHLELWGEAARTYLKAAQLDPLFAWHFNNLAWLSATSADQRALSGQLAVFAAERACIVSGWGCWCFLSTLAAAYARTGDTRLAADWQTIALELSLPHERDRQREQLHAYTAGQAWIDADPNVAAGVALTREEIADLDAETIRREVRHLMGESVSTSSGAPDTTCLTLN